MGRIISISAFHGAVPDKSLPLKLGLFRLSSTRFFPQIKQFDQGTNRQDFRPSPSISAFICVICGHEIPWSTWAKLQITQIKADKKDMLLFTPPASYTKGGPILLNRRFRRILSCTQVCATAPILLDCSGQPVDSRPS